MKPVIVDPGATARAQAYALWMDAPNPMVTFFKTLDVTPLMRLSRRKGLKFNMLLCWCIGRYRRRFLKTTLTVSFQFHHTQMDGAHAGRFLELVQQSIRQLRASAARNSF